jgi:hypothetical protein
MGVRAGIVTEEEWEHVWVFCEFQACVKGRSGGALKRMGAKMYPWENLKSLRTACGINVSSEEDPQAGDHSGCWRILVGSPSHSVNRTQDRVFRMVFAL